jgi:hypothetical protein
VDEERPVAITVELAPASETTKARELGPVNGDAAAHAIASR